MTFPIIGNKKWKEIASVKERIEVNIEPEALCVLSIDFRVVGESATISYRVEYPNR